MNKKIIGALVFSSFGLTMLNAQAAAPDAELKVTGVIAAPTCSVISPNGGVYNMGKISPSLIKSSGATQINDVAGTTLNWKVSCDADTKTYLVFKVTDNRQASSSASTNGAAGLPYFGLGFVNSTTNTGKIGYYTVTANNAVVDTVLGTTFAIAGTATSPGTAASAISLVNGSITGWSTGTTGAILKAGSQFSMDLNVKAYVGSSADMGKVLTDDLNLDGSLTLAFAYGL